MDRSSATAISRASRADSGSRGELSRTWTTCRSWWRSSLQPAAQRSGIFTSRTRSCLRASAAPIPILARPRAPEKHERFRADRQENRGARRLAGRDIEENAQAHQGGGPGGGGGVEVHGHSRLVARRDALHRRVLQGHREADLRQGRFVEGPGEALQLEPRREGEARDRHPRGRSGRRGRIQGAHPWGRRTQYIGREGKAKASEIGMPTRRQILILAAGSTALASVAGITRAQTYPTRPLRILVGFVAGGNFDIVARLMGQWLSEELHQPVIIENRPGASSNLATEAVVRAPADGYTLLLGGAVNAVNATLYEGLGFNFISDLVPVAGVVRFPNVMTVGASFPARTVPEFIAYAKVNPAKISHGSSGNGTTQHLAGELFKMMTGVDFLHVPYKGGSQAITALLGGQVQVLFEALPPSIPHIKSGQFRALAVTTATRSAALPDLPTLGEFVTGYEASGWNGICAPKNTPSEILEKLNRSINASVADPKVKARLADLGATTLGGSSGDFGKLIAEETEKWGKVIRAGNIKPA